MLRLHGGVSTLHSLRCSILASQRTLPSSNYNDQRRQISCSRQASAKNSCRIGCASGFWGDTPTAVKQLVDGGELDYLILDYLSEITMSLLTAAKAKDPKLGFAPDFVLQSVGPQLKSIKKKGIKVISNAGGINPEACGAAIAEAAARAGVDITVGVVTGDDLSSKVKDLVGTKDTNTGEALPSAVQSINAYIGAGPIVRALELGADVVITGRCADSSMALAPAVHHHQWGSVSIGDGAAGASIAGHLVECGAQATGGNHTDWYTVEQPHNIGFPIASVASDGSCIISKPPSTGGKLCVGGVTEQLLYEVGDPRAYVLPDLAVDITGVKVTEGSSGLIHVEGARGLPPTDSYKVGATHLAGFKATVVCAIGGPRAALKAQRTASSVLDRTNAILKAAGVAPITNTVVRVLGNEDTYGHMASSPCSRESVLWLSVQHPNKKALQIFAREIAAEGTGGVPGLMGLIGGRPKIAPILRFHSSLIKKTDVPIRVTVGSHTEEYSSTLEGTVPHSNYVKEHQPTTEGIEGLARGNHKYKLEELAFTRSGDKGNSANVAVISRHPAVLPYLQRALTSDSVANYMRHVFPKDVDPKSCVKRYEVGGVSALNFILSDSLGGGGVASSSPDPQGKAFGQMLLDFELGDMPSLKELCGEETLRPQE